MLCVKLAKFLLNVDNIRFIKQLDTKTQFMHILSKSFLAIEENSN